MKRSIPASLSGKRIAITGSTGFLGTALVERLLRCVPDCELLLLIRPGRSGSQRRAEREIFRNACFDKLKDELGADGFADCLSRRVQVIDCDISQDDLQLPPCDIFIHSAAAVAFDNPLDQAMETNLAGPLRLMAALHETAEGAAAENGANETQGPHFIAISTAYVAGSRKGKAPEELISTSPFSVEIDWVDELESARRLRAKTEDESRQPDRLAEFTAEAAKRLGAAGTTALATRREQLRRRWVEQTLIDAGRTRAAALGFADAYTFTKALAEQALCERRVSTGTDADANTTHTIPLSIVRPSIIESSLAEPHPGWIRGFRMAEPIIINYSQGLLEDFPAVPESIIDIIPVDLVAAAVCAVAATEPPAEPEVYHVASGSTNPFYFQDLHDWVYDWFIEHPVYDEHDQPITPPTWSFPSRTRVTEKLNRTRKALTTAEAALRMLPFRGAAAEFYADLEENREKLDRAAEYMDLYGMYVECQATYLTDRLLALWDSLDATDQAQFNFDPRVVDWRRYLSEIHLPSVVSTARIKTKPSGGSGIGVASGEAQSGSSKNETIMERRRQQILSPERHLAAFDLENTLLASNVVTSWGWLATKNLSRGEQAKIVGQALLEAPRLLSLDRADRSDFLRYFYKRYRDAPTDQLAADSWEMFSDLLLQQAFPSALRRVRQHRALGHRTVLITGALDFVIEPFRPLFDTIICPSLGVTEQPMPVDRGDRETDRRSHGRNTSRNPNSSRYTGRMRNTPPIGENRAQALSDYVADEGLLLDECVAYADSTSDLPMLELVGFPVAVNPELKLASLARRRGWLVEDFQKSPGGPRKLLPIAPPKNSRASFKSFKVQR